MAQQYKVLVKTGQAKNDQALTVEQGQAAKGQALRIEAQAGVKYELQGVDKAAQVAPANVKVKRVGKDLHILFDDSEQADVIMEDYFEVLSEVDSALIGQAENGSFYEYIPEDPEFNGLIHELAEGSQSVHAALGGSQVWGSGAALEVTGSGAALGVVAFNPLLAALGLAGAGAAVDAAGNASEQTVTLAVNNLDEVAPGFTSGLTSDAVAENIAAGTVIYTATATDTDFNSPDTASSITYSLKAGTGDAASFSIDTSSGAVTLTDSPDFETKPNYSFTVVATDAAGNVSEQEVTLAVNNLDEVAPGFTSGSTATAVAENIAAGTVIYTAAATDTDFNSPATADSVAYSLKAGAGDAASFSIDTSSGAVTLTDSPDFETKPNYSFTVVATDAAGNASEQEVTLAVNNMDEVAPGFTSGSTATAVAENIAAGTVIYTAAATDTDFNSPATADTASSITYSLKAGTGDAASFSIDTDTGAVTLTDSPDFETKPNYSFTVVATDAAGNASEQTVTLAVNNLDEVAPGFTSGSAATAVAENIAAGSVIYTAAATDTDFNSPATADSVAYSLKAGAGDAASFSIDTDTGAVTLTGSPDFETKPNYSFTVVATDAAGNVSEQEVTLAVNNMDEVAPGFTSGSTATAVAENIAAGTVIYTAAATDTDFNSPATADTASSITYSLKAGTGDAASFSIDTDTGAVTLTDSPDFETKPNYSFTVVATDAAGNASEQTVTLAVNNLDEVAPGFTSGSAATAVAENIAAGTVIYTTAATDTDFNSPDTASSITYSLKAGTGDAASFSIDTDTGAVTLTGSPDFETKPNYSFTVVATDAAGNASEQTVTLAVNNLDEVAPGFTSGSTATAVAENIAAGTVIYTAAATDTDFNSPDTASSITYSLKAGAGDAASFSIDTDTGAVTLTDSPDFETKPNYSFTVVATDAAGNASEQEVTLAVNNVNETPINTVPGALTATEDVNKVISGLSISDVDAGAGNLTVTLAVTHGTLAIDAASSGVILAANNSASVTLTGSVSQINALLAGTTGVSYVPTAGFNGQSVLTMTTDDGGNTGLGNALTDADTVDITVTLVNDAPAGADALITVLEDGSKTFAATDFGFTDASDTPANALSAVIITTVPTSGTLKLNGTDVAVGQVIAAVDLGSLVYAPAANANGAGYATIGFKVQDDGSASNGGVDTSTTANTLTINVTTVNDQPGTVALSYTGLEDNGGVNLATAPVPTGAMGALVSSLTDILASSNDVDNTNLGVAMTSGLSTSANGKLWYSTDNGSNWTDLSTLSLSETNALVLSSTARLYFQGNANVFGSSLATASIRLWDGTDSAASGSFADVTSASGASGAYAASNSTLTINLTAINDEPTLSAKDLGIRTNVASNLSIFNDVQSGLGNAAESAQKFVSLTLTVSGLFDDSSESLTIDGTTVALVIGSTTTINGWTASVNLANGSTSDTATVTLTRASGASVSELNTLVDGMRYTNASSSPTDGDRVITITSLQDNGGTANAGDDTVALNIASTITLDTTASTTLATIDAIHDDVGLIKGVIANNGKTDDTSLNLSGTLNNVLAPGETLRIYDGATLLGTAIVTTTGATSTWTFVDFRTLTNAQTVVYKAVVFDGLNEGIFSNTYSAMVDLTPPIITITSVAGDALNVSGTDSTGNGTYDALERGSDATTANTPLPVISGTTDAEVGQIVVVTLNGKSYSTTVQSGGIWSVEVPNADAVALNHGNTLPIFAAVTDQAGLSATDMDNKLVVNIAAPDVPTVDNKFSSTLTPTLTGMAQKSVPTDPVTYIALETGDTLAITVGGATYTGTLDTDAANNGLPTGLGYNAATNQWSLDTGAATPSSGSLLLASGNSYDVGVSLHAASATKVDISTNELAINTTLPAIAIDTISGDSLIDASEKNTPLIITGITDAEVGSTVTITGLDGTPRNTTVIAGTGSQSGVNVFSVTVPAAAVSALADNTYTVSASVTNVYGLNGTDTEPVKVDYTASTTTVVIDDITDDVGTVTGVVIHDGRTDDTQLGVSGTLNTNLVAGEVVQVYDGMTLLGTATVTGTTWTFADPRTLINAQKVTYTALVFDGANKGAVSNSYSATVDLTPPTVVNDTATAQEKGGAGNATAGIDPSGDVLSNDSAGAGDSLSVKDVTGASSATAVATTGTTNIVGSYGTLTIAANGSYSYAVDQTNTTVQALNASSTGLSEVFTYTAKDVAGLTASATLTITVNGTNDSATISGTTAGAVTEDAAVNTASGTLTVTDVDTGEALLQTPSSLSGTYGSFALDTATGVWTYTLDNTKVATQALTEGQAVTDQLAVTSQDGTGTQTVTVTITGTNDTASISGTATGAVTEDAAVNTASGTLTVTDVDTGEAVFQTPSSLVGSYGNYTFNASTGEWTYALDNAKAAVQALPAGSTLTDTLEVKSSDGSATQNIVVTINGTNDSAIISGTTAGAVTEDAAVNTASGTLTVNDVDSGEALLQTPSSLSGTYGSFALDTATGVWTYTLDNTKVATQALTEGQAVTDQLAVTSQDGTGTQTVTVTITGVNDAPVLADTVLSLPAVVQGATAPVNGTAVGVLVNSLVGGITDVDAGAVTGIAITGVNTGGTLYYTLDGGTTWTSFTDFTNNRALGILSDSDNRVYFVPASGDVGTVSSALTFRAWDQAGGAAEGAVTWFTGTTASYSTATDTISQYVVKPVTINAVSTDDIVSTAETLVISGTADNNATVALTVKGQTVNVVADASGNWSYDGSKVRYVMVRKDLENKAYGTGLGDTQVDTMWNIGDVRAMDGLTNRATSATVTFSANGTKSPNGSLIDDSASTYVEIGGSSYSAADRDVWVQLDLGASYALSSIDVLARAGGWAERLNGSVVYTSGQDMSAMTRAQLDEAFNVNSSVVSLNNDGTVYTLTSPTSTNGLDLATGSNTITATEVVQGATSTATRAVVRTSTWSYSNTFDGADPLGGGAWVSGGTGTTANTIVNADVTDGDNEFAMLNSGILPLYRANGLIPGSNQIVTQFDVAFDMDVSGMLASNTTNRFELRYVTAGNASNLTVGFLEGTISVTFKGVTQTLTGSTLASLSARTQDHATVTMSENGTLTITLSGGGAPLTWTATVANWTTANTAGGRFLLYGDSQSNGSAGWIDNLQINTTVASSVALPTVSNISVYNNTVTEVLVTPGAGSADTTPVLKGTATAGATVKVYEGTQLIASTTADATTGAWSAESTSLTDGAHTLSVRAVDANGNIGEATSVSLLVKTTTSTWTYSNSFDNAIDPMAGATLTTGSGGTPVANADTSDTDLEFKIIDGTGTENIQLAKVMAIGANQRMAAFTSTFDMDMTSVSSGTLTNRFELRYGFGFNDGLSVKFAESAITVFWNGVQVVAQATALSARGTDRVSISMDDTGNFSVGLVGYGTGSANSPLTVTGTVPTSLWTTQAMTNYKFSFYGDTAGISASSAWIDNLAINATVKSSVLLPIATITNVNDNVGAATGALTSGSLTDDTQPTLTGTATPGALVRVYDGDFFLGAVYAHMTTGVWTFAVNGTGVNTYGTGSVHTLSQGLHTLNVRAVDASGNMGEASSFSLMVDSMPPTGGTLTLATDTGSSASDRITSNGLINVTGLEGGTTTWQYSTDAGVTWSTGNGTSFTLAEGIYAANAVQVRQTDAAGFVQVTPAKYATQINVDTSNPAALLAVYFSDDHGISGSDWTPATDAGASTLYMVAASGARASSETAQYSTNGGSTWTNFSSAFDTSGFATGLSTFPFSTSTTTYSFRVLDAAGNASSVITKTFTPSATPTSAATAGTFNVPSVANGSSVIGSGSDDIFVLDQAGITNYLSQPTAYVEGHYGNDTLRLTGAGTSLNLLDYMNDYTLNKIQGMEFIDMSSDTGAQTLIGNAQAFVSLTKYAWLNNANLSSNYQMVIKGDSADTLVLGKGDGFDTTGFTKTGTSSSAANNTAAYDDDIAYDIWTNSVLKIQLLVQQGIVVTSETSTTNVAPVLTDTVLNLAAVAKDSAAPSGAVGTLVSALVGGMTDSFAASQKGIAITGVNTTNGTLYYSTDGGANWSTVTGTTNTNALLLAADGDNRVYFKPNVNFTGTVADAMTIRAWDRTSGADGAYFSTTPNGTTTAFSTATDTVSVQSVAPVTINNVSADNIVAMNEVITLTGTANANATVNLNVGGTARSVVANASGNWSYTTQMEPVVRYVMVRKNLDGSFPDSDSDTGIFTIADIKVNSGTTNLAAGMAVNTGTGTTMSGSVTNLTDSGTGTGSFYETSVAGEQWVQLDLGGYYRVDSVQISARDSWESRANGANIFMSAYNLSGKTSAQLDAYVTNGLASKTAITGIAAGLDGFTATAANAADHDNTGLITASESVSGVSSSASKTVTWRPFDAISIVSAVDNTIGATPLALGSGSTTCDTTPTLQGTLVAPLAAGEEVAIWWGNAFRAAATVSGTTWSWTPPTTNYFSTGTYTIEALVTTGHLGVATQGSSVFVLNIASTPLVLDLNGDGVQTTSLNEGAQFDLLNTGSKVNMGWVSKQDGLLAMDLNGDGVINSGAELFGDHTVLADGSLAQNGWEALKAQDSNHDGMIDAQDANFNQLRVWVDANGNGTTDAGELHTLADKHIASINLNHDASSVGQNGNLVQMASSFTTTDGATHDIADVGFKVQNATSNLFVLTGGDNLDLSGLGNAALVNSIDMVTDAAANTVKLTLADVLGVASTDGVHQLVLTGAANDKVMLVESEWDDTGTVISDAGHNYAVFNGIGDASVQLLIDLHMLQSHQTS